MQTPFFSSEALKAFISAYLPTCGSYFIDGEMKGAWDSCLNFTAHPAVW